MSSLGAFARLGLASVAAAGLVVALGGVARADDPEHPDDPKLDRALRGRNEHPAPAYKFTYRHFELPNLDGSTITLDAGQIDLYPVSARWIRIGTSLEAGGGSGVLTQTVGGTTTTKGVHPWYVVSSVSLGIQYPWRVTPFLEGRMGAGLIGGELVGSHSLSYAWLGGIEGGAEVYLVDRFYLSAALGWVHGVYHGVDLAWSLAHPNLDPLLKDISGDSFTIKIGMGI